MGRKEFLASLNPNKPREKFTAKKGSLKRSLQRAAAIGLVSLTIMGAAGCTKATNEAPTTEPSTSQSTTINDKYGYLNSPNAILQDFKERYVEAYNKENNTNLKASDIDFISSTQDYLFITSDGQYVTHGTEPYVTKDILGKYGNYTHASKTNTRILQTVYFGTNDTIEMCTADSGKTVLSGRDKENLLNNLNNKLGEKETVLSEFDDLANLVVEANASYYDSKNSDVFVKKYKSLAKGIDEQNELIYDDEGR